MEVVGVTLAVTSVVPSGQADELGVGVGWRVRAMGAVPVKTLGAYKTAVEDAGKQHDEAEAPAGGPAAGLVITFGNVGGNTEAVTKDSQNFRKSVFAEEDGMRGEADDYGSDEDDNQEHIEGYLLKKGTNVVNPWQSRWFIGHGHYLRYYKNNGEASDPRNCQAAIDLCLCGRIADPKGKVLVLAVPGGKDVTLKAKSNTEAAQWAESLRKLQGDV